LSLICKPKEMILKLPLATKQQWIKRATMNMDNTCASSTSWQHEFCIDKWGGGGNEKGTKKE